MRRVIVGSISEAVSLIDGEREKQGVSRNALAKRMGVRQPFIQRVLSGSQACGLTVIQEIAGELGLQLSICVQGRE